MNGKANRFDTRPRYLMIMIVYIMLLAWVFSPSGAMAQWPHVVLSADGTPISYEVSGTGDTTLVFVHGWSCDARYWKTQIPHFSKTHRTVTLDLAGHGHSGATRTTYTMKSFGEDVKAVADVVGSTRLILVGHSMGGQVIAQAARLMPGRVIGVIGIDTLQNIEYPMTREKLDQMTAPLIEDFPTATRQFVSEMLSAGMDPSLREWILADMSSAPKAVALSAMNEMMSLYITGDLARLFKELPIPVVTVNADLWPIDYEANRRHMASFDAIVLKNADHFLMMNRSDEFNRALDKAIVMILSQKTPTAAGHF